MKMIGSGTLSKMCVRLEDPVQYAMSLSGAELPLNKLIDSTTKMVFTGENTALIVVEKQIKASIKATVIPVFKNCSSSLLV